jgi:hypothetical protein
LTSIHPFDLQARAERAAASLTALLDPHREGLMYFLGEWRARPPRADHGLWDCGDGSGRHLDALTLARTMVREGSPVAEPDAGEAQIEGWMLRLLGEDGLSWLPQERWAEPWGKELLLADPAVDDRFAEISWAQRGTLMGLTSRFLRTGDEPYLELARKMVDGLLRVAVHDRRGLFYPEGYYREGGWRYDKPGLHQGLEEYNAAAVLSALRLYEATGYEPALELAKGLTEFALYHTPCYLPDGGFRATLGDVEGHFHTHSNFALCVLKLGVALGRREYVSWARQTYGHLRTWGTEFGWFPEGLGHRHGEVCSMTDMIELALLLGRHVHRGYYADAERFGRNHLLEGQFLEEDRLRRALDAMPADEDSGSTQWPYSTTEGVTESQVGGFASRSTLNDAFHLDATALMQCCNAAGTRALYDLWRYAVEEGELADGGRSRQAVHLRFSVETPALRVVSHEPTVGRLDILARQPSRVEVRLPEGASQALVLFGASGSEAPRMMDLVTRDGYVRFDAEGGQRVEVRYPLAERVDHYQVGTPERLASCTGYWRGETVMRVEPAGPFYPLYERLTDLAPVEPAPPARPPIESL